MTCARPAHLRSNFGGSSRISNSPLSHFSSIICPFSLEPWTFDCAASPLFVVLTHIARVSPVFVALTHFIPGVGVARSTKSRDSRLPTCKPRLLINLRVAPPATPLFSQPSALPGGASRRASLPRRSSFRWLTASLFLWLAVLSKPLGIIPP